MERLWAPWRMKYILSTKDNGEYDCIFCGLPAEGEASYRENLILSCGERAFVIMNRYPYNNAHLMVVPRLHVADPAELSDEDYAVVCEVLRQTSVRMRQVYRPDGINVGMNLGGAAGAGIADHCHYHLVPRWRGDTNFMPVLNDTRGISEGLDQTYDKLVDCLRDLCPAVEEKMP